MIKQLLAPEALRKRISFALRQHYYADLEIAPPIGAGLHCPIVNREYWVSFEEIFFSDEYLPILDAIPLPKRWLDLGCHAGFFSLWMIATLRRKFGKVKAQSLQVDGDARVADSIRAIVEQNGLQGQMEFLHGVIGGGADELMFNQSGFMSSAVTKDGSTAEGARPVRVATQAEILRKLPPPYDMVKVDIEGGEHDFLTHYGEVLQGTNYLLMEWHSWHSGGGGVDSLRKAANAAGFREKLELRPAHEIGGPGRLCGVILFERAGV